MEYSKSLTSNISVKNASNGTTKDTFDLLRFQTFQNSPWLSNLMQFWQRYYRTKIWSGLFLNVGSVNMYNSVQIVLDIFRVAQIWIFLACCSNGNRNTNFIFLSFIRAIFITRCVMYPFKPFWTIKNNCYWQSFKYKIRSP